MIRNEVKLIGRLTADPELKYTKNSNTPVCNVVLAVNNIYNDDAEYLHLVLLSKSSLMKLIILASPKRVLIRVKIFLTLTQTTSHRKNIR